MSLTPDQILDRIKLKKQVINWRLLAVMSVVMLFLSLFSSNDTRYGTKPSVIESSYIARINVDGVIFNDPDRLEILKDLTEDKAVKAVIVHVNSPGGTVVGGENLYNAIRKLSEKKPTVAVMGEMAASAGYMTAIATDRLIAHQSTITGSIGVLAHSFEVTELAEKMGVKFNNFKSSPLKGGPIPTEKLTPEMRASMMETIDDMYDMFVTMVSQRRNIPKDHLLKSVADGRAFTGRQAIKLALIDEIGDEETALNWLKNVKKIGNSLKVHDIALEKQQDKFSKFLEYADNFGALMQNIAKSGYLIFF
jgi:protease IV